jgi:hypothetical protein
LKEEEKEEEEPEPSAPEIIMPLENVTIDEGEMAKFMAKISGYPRPRVSWFINNTHVVTVS